MITIETMQAELADIEPRLEFLRGQMGAPDFAELPEQDRLFITEHERRLATYQDILLQRVEWTQF